MPTFMPMGAPQPHGVLPAITAGAAIRPVCVQHTSAGCRCERRATQSLCDGVQEGE